MLNAALRLRRELHKHPDLSGQERETARRIVDFFVALHPDNIIEHLGGNGVAIIFSGEEAGPTILLRCELDALPVEETLNAAHCSIRPGLSHACGHDGHMAILAAVGTQLALKRPHKGKVVLLYQPAEETGAGAAAVLADSKFAAISPDSTFALHNLPGYPLGQVIIRSGTFACASRGMAIRLLGTAAHAAQPETGQSPTNAMCRIIEALTNLPPGLVPASETAFATVVGATLGERAFGIAPDRADIWLTLRSENDTTMSRIVDYAERVVRKWASADNLEYTIGYEDIFPATLNSPRAVERVCRATEVDALHILDKPFRWSEDFGRFTALCDGALIGIGAGTDVPALHNPDYDFPDSLIVPAAQLLLCLLDT